MRYAVILPLLLPTLLTACQNASSETVAPTDPFAQCDAKWTSIDASMPNDAQAKAAGIVMGNQGADASLLISRGTIRPQTLVLAGECGVGYVGDAVVEGSTVSINVFCPLEGAKIRTRETNGTSSKTVMDFTKGCRAA